MMNTQQPNRTDSGNSELGIGNWQMVRPDHGAVHHATAIGLPWLPRLVVWLVLLTAVLLMAPAVHGQQQSGEPEREAPTADAQQQEQTQEDSPPSLDDLLGLEEDERDDASDAATRDSREELDRRLREQEISENFRQAIEQMKLSADLLDQQFDAGLGTQRLQEEVIAKLEVLIDQAKEQQQQQQQSSSSSSSQQQQQPGRRPQQPQDQAQRNQENAEGNREVEGPARQDGEMNTVLEETRSEWGHLPQRVRDMLLQGQREQYSSMYERLTREYYRRLAEEASDQ